MHAASKKMRQLVSIISFAGVAGLFAATMTSASATTSHATATTVFALRGSVA